MLQVNLNARIFLINNEKKYTVYTLEKLEVKEKFMLSK